MICCAEQNIQLWPAEGTSGESLICATTSAGCFIGDDIEKATIILEQAKEGK